MRENWLLSPPVAFMIILFCVGMLSIIFSRLACRVKKTNSGARESYACGEANYDHMAQPDYSNFFPFAFFFTLAHVATLIITTVPTENLGVFVMAALYIGGAGLGLYILFRK